SAPQRPDRLPRLADVDEVILDALQEDRAAGGVVAAPPLGERRLGIVALELGLAEHDRRGDEAALALEHLAEDRHRLLRLLLLEKRHAALVGEAEGGARF